MTSKDFAKVFTQLEAKPAVWNKVLKHNKPKSRPACKLNNRCKNCGSPRAHISVAGLHLCRKCFRLNADKLGFKKLN